MPRIQQLVQDDKLKNQYALVYAPKRGRRARFPDNCVYIQADESSAIAAADQEKNLHAALVCGPSRSSEGFMLYYLVKWLVD